MDTEFALAKSEPDFKSIVEGVADVIWLAEVDGALHYLSPQFKTIFGLEPEDWIGRSPYELVHPDDLKIVEKAIERQNGDQSRISFECRHLCQDGYIWVSIIAVPIFDDEGNMVRRQGAIRDISDRKRLEKEQARLVQILQSTSDFVGICQPDVGILWQNNPFRELRSDLDIAGQDVSISELYPDWAYEIVKNEGLPTAIEDGIWSGETALLDQSGNEIPTSQVIIAHKSDSGELEFVSTILRDISQNKATELELRNAQAELLATTENVPGVIYRTLFHPDGSHSFAYVSPSFRTIFGIEPDAPLKDAGEFWTRIHPDDLGEVRRKAKRSAETGEPYHATYRLRHDEKGMRWYGSWALPSRLENGDIAFDGILIDVHDRKVSELAQSDAQAEYRRMTDNVPGVLFRALIHADGRHEMTFVNDSAREVLGLDPEVLLGDTNEVWRRIHPNDLEEIERKMRQSMETLEPKHSSYRLVLEEKGTRWIESWSLPTRLENGDTVFDGIMIDITDRKTEELKQSEAQSQLRDMTENVPGVISRVVLHPDGSHELSYVSSRVRELYGLDPQALMADMNEVWKRIHPDDVEAVRRAMSRSAETLEPYQTAYRLVLEDRGTRWVHAWSLPSKMDNGDIVFDGIVIDVTDLGRLDSLQREINFRQIFDNAPDAVFLIGTVGDDKGQIVASNRAAERMHGYDAGELIGRTIEDLDTPEFAQKVPERLKRLAQGEMLTFEVEHVHKNGSVFPVEVTASRILIDDRPYVLAFDRDLTERKKAEQERIELQNQVLKTQKLAAELDLTKTQTRLQGVTENIPGLVYQFVLRTDGTQKVTYISAKCREFFGVEQEAILEDAEVFWRLLVPEDLEQAQEKVAHSARTLERFDIEFRMAVPGQGIRWYNDIGQPQRQPNGDVVWDGVLLDVTDRREVELANEVLAKATESKDLFLANMSHELRTPLSAILGITEGLKQGLFGETSHKQLESLRVVEESGLHLLNLINEILDMAKIETGTTSLKLSNVKVAELCDSCLDLVAPQAARKAIKLSFIKSTNNLPLLIADETRLRQILINLLGNALKFTPEGGKVSLEVERLSSKATSSSDETLRFVVSDNGIGIERNHIDTLFQPFVQVDNSLSRNFSGSGLGLSLVKKFVELHSGTVSVESEPGKGSRFIVELPYLKQDAKPDQEADTTPPRNSANVTGSDGSPLILLAEDNDHVAMAIGLFLESSNFRVVRAINGAVAVELALEHKPDLILMDIQMPVMDGLEAIRQIRSTAELQDTPIIALSGFAMPEDSDRCLQAGANTFLSKPCKMPVMISKIRQLISSRTTN